ncbi:MAG: hypothetical protein J6J17_04450 [Bacilli bacterium]|nr:hypothetical protein [Bacilli bacterium]
MKSRLDKYTENDNFSRVEKNKNLYDDIYSNTNYSNMVVIDDSNEIDIIKIKEIVDKENNKAKRVEKNNFDKEKYDSIIPSKNFEKKTYDINEVLREAKSKRDIIEEVNEKRKIQNYKFKENLDEELSKTRKVYENLIKEEKELLNIMNTLTNVNSNDIALDMFSDLTSDKDIPDVPNNIDSNQTSEINIKQINDDTTEYSTDTFMFNTKDFEGINSMRDNVEKTNLFIKILIFLLTVIVIAGLSLIVYKFFIE